MYVFKIIPLLNPDGVYNGYYRSDVLGHNLNRVYLNPKKDTQPSIYAVRKLIRYYNNEKDIDDDPEANPSANIENNNELIGMDLPNKNANIEPIVELDIASSSVDETDVEIPSRESSEEKSRPSVLTEINIEAKNNRKIERIEIIIPPSNPSTPPSISLTQSPSTETDLDPKPSSSTETTSASSNAEEISIPTPTPVSNSNTSAIPIPNSTTTTNITSKVRKSSAKLKIGPVNKYVVKSSIPKLSLSEASTSNIEGIKVKKLSVRPSSASLSNQMPFTPTTLSGRESCSDSSSRYSSSTFESGRNEKKKNSSLTIKSNTGNNSKMNRKFSKTDGDASNVPLSAGVISQKTKRSLVPRKIPHIPTPNNINISSDFCKDPNQSNCDEQSNMFLYIDLHGHASKKGVFMYGNYLPKIAESVECMLLPRLMSMNSHHFHFDACVFSERNMYHKYVTLCCCIRFIFLWLFFGITEENGMDCRKRAPDELQSTKQLDWSRVIHSKGIIIQENMSIYCHPEKKN